VPLSLAVLVRSGIAGGMEGLRGRFWLCTDASAGLGNAVTLSAVAAGVFAVFAPAVFVVLTADFAALGAGSGAVFVACAEEVLAAFGAGVLATFAAGFATRAAGFAALDAGGSATFGAGLVACVFTDLAAAEAFVTGLGFATGFGFATGVDATFAAGFVVDFALDLAAGLAACFGLGARAGATTGFVGRYRRRTKDICASNMARLIVVANFRFFSAMYPANRTLTAE